MDHKIEFKGKNRGELWVDGQLVGSCHLVHRTFASNSALEEVLEISLNRNEFGTLADVPSKQLTKSFHNVLFRRSLRSEILESAISGWGQVYVHFNIIGNLVRLSVSPKMSLWVRPYSFNELRLELANIITRFAERGLATYNSSSSPMRESIGISCPFDAERSINDTFDYACRTLAACLDTANQSLLQRKSHSVLQVFDFPASVRVSCEQYLVYFAQFLKDLGIKARTEISKDASRVLFRITPEDKNQALDSIREALNVYLQIPIDPAAKSALNASSDIAAIQLRANIFHLQSQVELGHAMIQLKDATISVKQTEIDFLRETLNSRQVLNAQTFPSATDEEQIIPGIISVKPLEHRGIVVNTPEIIRKLKRKFEQ